MYNSSDEHPYLDNVRFINPIYFKNPPNKPEQHTLTWEEWVYEYLGVRRHSRLISTDGHCVSLECEYVESRLPAKIVGFLKYNWAAESQRIESNPDVIADLEQLEVECEGGLEVCIKDTYLPLPALTSLRSRFMPADEPIPFPFLLLDDGLADAIPASNLDFLTKLGVKKDPDLRFYLDILRYMGELSGEDRRSVEVSRILDLYKSIHGACIASSDTRKEQAYAR